jgi:hypothetical protein
VSKHNADTYSARKRLRLIQIILLVGSKLA